MKYFKVFPINSSAISGIKMSRDHDYVLLILLYPILYEA